MSNSVFFDLHEKVHQYYVKALWKSQKKKFKEIGSSSGVLDIPYVQGYSHIIIGDSFNCGKDVRIEAWEEYGDQSFNPLIKIGNNVTFTDRCYLSCIDSIDIGDGVLLGRDVFITDNSHGDTSPEMLELLPIRRLLTSKGPVIIGKNVWIGGLTTIVSGVTIGDNSIIGANSFVNKDIPDNCVAAGNPAKVIKSII